MKDILILGDGVHACEMVELLERMDTNHQYNLLGFVGKTPRKENMKEGNHNDAMIDLKTPEACNEYVGILMGYPVYHVDDLDRKFSHAELTPDNTFDLSFKQKYQSRMITLIDPSCFISRTAKISQGCVLYPGCFVGRNVILESFVFCLSGSIINHDDIIGAGSILASGVTIAGNVTIGQQVYLGQACTIRQQLHVGDNSLIGTGAVVVKDVAPNSVMVGNPAHVLIK